MDKQELKQKVTEMILDEKRKGEVLELSEVLDDASELVLSVGLDRKYIYDSAKSYLTEEGRNPVNAVLGIIGYRIVRSDTMRRVEPDPESQGGAISSAYKLNEEKCRESIEKIGAKLSEFEKKCSERDAERVDRINELIAGLEKEQQKNEQIQRDSRAMISMMADRIQYMLSIIGPEKTGSLLEKQVYEMMEDLDIEACWDAEAKKFPESMMFNRLVVENVSEYKMKPCLIRQDQILVKGCRFTVG